MGARQKLNQSHVNGSLLLAVVAGWLTDSWVVFIVTLVILIGLNLYQGEIRPRRRTKNHSSTSIDSHLKRGGDDT